MLQTYAHRVAGCSWPDQEAQEKGWETLYETYTHTNHRNPRDIEDAIGNYLKSNFFPRLFRVVATLQPEDPLYHLFDNEWHNYSKSSKYQSYSFLISSLL